MNVYGNHGKGNSSSIKLVKPTNMTKKEKKRKRKQKTIEEKKSILCGQL